MSNEQPAKSSIMYSKPVYVWLFVAYPILYLFSLNVGIISESDVYFLLGLVLLLWTVLFFVIRRLLRSALKSALLCMIVVVILYSYWFVQALLPAHAVNDLIMIGGYTIIALAVSIWVMRLKRTEADPRMTLVFNTVAGLLVGMVLIPILRYYGTAVAYRATPPPPARSNIAADSLTHPDIYYIILDGYGSDEHYMQVYGYDNSAFTEALEERGFFVADQSRSSFTSTLPSLSSTLNMRYYTTQDVGLANTVTFLFHEIADSLVAQKLQTLGYSYVFMVSGFDTYSTTADLMIDFYPNGPKQFRYPDPAINKTRKESIISLLNSASYPLHWTAPQRALDTWDEAEQIPQMPEATFTYIHLIKPHEPIAFDRHGDLVPLMFPSSLEHDPVEAQRLYFEQLTFVNQRTLDMIDAILANSDTSPIIIIQGDHGSRRFEDGVMPHFGILNALYFPNRSDCLTDPAIAAINTFPTLLNCYFDTDIAEVEPRYFELLSGYENLLNVLKIEDVEAWEAAQIGSGER